jgi:hypothetical protein
MVEDQQLRTTELTSETAEINYTPLCEVLGLDTKHGPRLS